MRRERSYAGQIDECGAHPSTHWGTCASPPHCPQAVTLDGYPRGEYRGDVPAARISDDGLAYQKRRLLPGSPLVNVTGTRICTVSSGTAVACSWFVSGSRCQVP